VNTTLAMSVPTDIYLKIEKFRKENNFSTKAKVVRYILDLKDEIEIDNHDTQYSSLDAVNFSIRINQGEKDELTQRAISYNMNLSQYIRNILMSYSYKKMDLGGSENVAGNKEQKFYTALQDLFIGVQTEGKSGYTNLMNIKNKYFEDIKKYLVKDIDKVLIEFPEFREELFDNLFTFFSRYFNDNGTLYFANTPFHQQVYMIDEKITNKTESVEIKYINNKNESFRQFAFNRVYTDNDDVMLFWKTNMLYYVKTDNIFRSVKVKIDGYNFYVDAGGIENKQNNEKRQVIFNFKDIKDSGKEKVIEINAVYSTHGRVTKEDEIIKDIENAGIEGIDESILRKVFAAFNKQATVDYFINKNAKQFLEEQLDLFIYQYLFKDERDEFKFSHKRLRQVQAIRSIALKLIVFISQFEDELVKIWNKPKFVMNSNYIITIDKLSKNIINKIINHNNVSMQIGEWENLGLIDTEFKIENIKDEKYKHLPLDTKYFKDVELDILSLFKNIDDDLDGWFIHSENYQALNGLKNKFNKSIDLIYIDPPYNTGSDGFLYMDKFKHSTWLTMMENRLELSKTVLKDDGIVLVSMGDLDPQTGESYRLQALLSNIFPTRFGNLIWKKRGGIGSFSERYLTENHEYIFVHGNKDGFLYENIVDSAMLREYKEEDEKGRFKWNGILGPSQQTRQRRPNLYYSVLYDLDNKKIFGFRHNGEDIIFDKEHSDNYEEIITPGNSTWLFGMDALEGHYKNGIIGVFENKGKFEINIKRYLYNDDGTVNGKILKSHLVDNKIKIGGNSEGTRLIKNMFYPEDYSDLKPKPLSLLEFLIERRAIGRKEIVLDYFAGSGTTAHAIINLNRNDGGNRKYICVEMADYAMNICIPRIKKAIFSSEWDKGKPGENNGISHFMKYFELEQYEDTLFKSKYKDDTFLLANLNAPPYEQYVFMRDDKLSYCIDTDKTDRDDVPDARDNHISIDLSGLYKNIDIAESLSLAAGKKIKSIDKKQIVFSDGSREEINDIKYNSIRPLIWW